MFASFVVNSPNVCVCVPVPCNRPNDAGRNFGKKEMCIVYGCPHEGRLDWSVGRLSCTGMIHTIWHRQKRENKRQKSYALCVCNSIRLTLPNKLSISFPMDSELMLRPPLFAHENFRSSLIDRRENISHCSHCSHFSLQTRVESSLSGALRRFWQENEMKPFSDGFSMLLLRQPHTHMRYLSTHSCDGSWYLP